MASVAAGGTLFISLDDVELPCHPVLSFLCSGERLEGSFSRIPGLGGSPFGVLSDRYGGGQSQKYFRGGKRAENVGAVLNFPVETLHGNRFPSLPSVGRGETGECQQVLILHARGVRRLVG